MVVCAERGYFSSRFTGVIFGARTRAIHEAYRRFSKNGETLTVHQRINFYAFLARARVKLYTCGAASYFGQWAAEAAGATEKERGTIIHGTFPGEENATSRRKVLAVYTAVVSRLIPKIENRRLSAEG